MPQSPCYKSVHIKPVTGVMDLRSNPDEVEFGGYRYVKNMVVDDDNRLCRMPGWTRAFAEQSVNNWDLHDQDLGQGYVRQQINMLYQAETPTGFSKLYAGTQNRIYELNTDTGNWRVISDMLGGEAETGCGEIRFMGAQLNQTILFTNGEDPIVYHVIDQPIIGDDNQAVSQIDDLVELNVSKAKVVIAWNNVVFLMNLEMDGQWQPNRILWSDFNRPLSYIPSENSISGFQDLDWGDSILNAKATKNSLIIYTTKGIWEVAVTGGDEVFSFQRRWKSGDSGKRVLGFKNTLVSTGEDHWYMGSDGIYKYNLFAQEPERVEYIHKGTKTIFNDINKSHCGMHVGGFEADKNQVWMSWGTSTDTCPSQTFVFNIRTPFTTYVDYGISAFIHHEPDAQSSLRNFILQWCICDLDEFEAYGGGFDENKEGGFCVDEDPFTCEVIPASFYSQTELNDHGASVEDWTGDPDADSLFTILGTTTINDLCGDEFQSDECNAERKFIFASVDDQCLKQTADVRYRELCIDFEGCGEYEHSGYQSRLLTSAMDLKLPDDDKIINRFAIEAHTIVESVPAQISLSIGSASQAVDPLADGGRCVILWEEQDRRDLVCLSDVDAQRHHDEGTRPNDELEWGLYHLGRYLYFDLVILNANTEPQDEGGVVCFSRFTFDAVADPRC